MLRLLYFSKPTDYCSLLSYNENVFCVSDSSGQPDDDRPPLQNGYGNKPSPNFCTCKTRPAILCRTTRRTGYTAALSVEQHESTRGSLPWATMGAQKERSQTGRWHNSLCTGAVSSSQISVSSARLTNRCCKDTTKRAKIQSFSLEVSQKVRIFASVKY